MNSQREYKLVTAESTLRPGIIKLLWENELPVADLDEGKLLFGCLIQGNIVGSAGLEIFPDCALLRSVSVRKDLRHKGVGKFIVAELEKIAKQKRIRCLYLLTTTAKDFFKKAGYETIGHPDAPPAVKNTAEFSSICPSSATMMRKFLS